jgi:hypothetical protein
MRMDNVRAQEVSDRREKYFTPESSITPDTTGRCAKTFAGTCPEAREGTARGFPPAARGTRIGQPF